jgi:hypothetical protein
MNFNWKFFVNLALPFVEAAGNDYVNKDTNDAGRDDMIGQSLIYVAKLLREIIADKPTLPTVPDVLK